MSRSRLTRAAAVWLVATMTLTGAALLAARLAGPRGLRLADTSRGNDPAGGHSVSSVDLRDVRMDAALARASRVTWDGFWRVPADGRYKLAAEGVG
ncbi:MAG TPA: hypothetical protein VFQ51_14035, partial [Vicinamibacteria bacterium]|nr:hypothetical protein [Vicinamibacteria bacterium]